MKNVQADLLPHQSLSHGGLILPGQVLLQSQDHTVGCDGGQDHVLKRRKGQNVKEKHFQCIIYPSFVKRLFKTTEKLQVVLCKADRVE